MKRHRDYAYVNNHIFPQICMKLMTEIDGTLQKGINTYMGLGGRCRGLLKSSFSESVIKFMAFDRWRNTRTHTRVPRLWWTTDFARISAQIPAKAGLSTIAHRRKVQRWKCCAWESTTVRSF